MAATGRMAASRLLCLFSKWLECADLSGEVVGAFGGMLN